MEPLLQLAQDHNNDLFVFVANYHAQTTLSDGPALEGYTREVLSLFAACGILDNPKTFLYRQSDNPQVFELAWYLSTFATAPELQRAHSYKDKIANGKTPSVALFSYPVLMAADILIHGAQAVPVGKDQQQHLEFARDWAIRINQHFDREIFTVPEGVIEESVAVIPGTDGRKMSKSYGNVISLLEDDAVIKKQIMSIVTDSKGMDEPKDPDTCHVMTLYKLFATPQEVAALEHRYRAEKGFGYGHAKLLLLEKYHERFGALREKARWYIEHPKELEKVFRNTQAAVFASAEETMQKIRPLMGTPRQ